MAEKTAYVKEPGAALRAMASFAAAHFCCGLHYAAFPARRKRFSRSSGRHLFIITLPLEN
jgi:hypothetical protein